MTTRATEEDWTRWEEEAEAHETSGDPAYDPTADKGATQSEIVRKHQESGELEKEIEGLFWEMLSRITGFDEGTLRGILFGTGAAGGLGWPRLKAKLKEQLGQAGEELADELQKEMGGDLTPSERRKFLKGIARNKKLLRLLKKWLRPGGLLAVLLAGAGLVAFLYKWSDLLEKLSVLKRAMRMEALLIDEQVGGTRSLKVRIKNPEKLKEIISQATPCQVWVNYWYEYTDAQTGDQEVWRPDRWRIEARFDESTSTFPFSCEGPPVNLLEKACWMDLVIEVYVICPHLGGGADRIARVRVPVRTNAADCDPASFPD